MVTLVPLAWGVGQFRRFLSTGVSGHYLMIGPFNPDGTPIKETGLSYQHPFETIQGSRGIFHENEVYHTKVDCLLYYNPYSFNVVADGTFDLPCRSLVYRDVAMTNPIICDFGLGLPGTSAYSKYYQIAYVGFDTDDRFVIYELSIYPTNPKRVMKIWRHRIQIRNNTVYNERTTLSPLAGAQSELTEIDWSLAQAEQVIGQFDDWKNSKHPSIMAEVSSGSTIVNMVPRTMSSPADLNRFLDTILRSLTSWGNNIQEVYDWGELAMTASESLNVTHINVLAFLRDLKDLRSLIPKLKNLSKLRTWANNYLAVKYGILPTISDLKKIFRAAGRLKPYLDRNGFHTYSARHDATWVSESSNLQSDLEQHVKLAIDNQEEALKAMIMGVESMGSLPTMKNVWELIPYTFIIDWFVQVGDFLGRLDMRQRLARYAIRYVTMSTKQTFQQRLVNESGRAPILGSIKVVKYHRWVTDHCPLPRLSLGTTLDGFSHWLESTALVIQRRK